MPLHSLKRELLHDTVFGTASEAEFHHIAVQTARGKTIQLVFSESPIAFHQFCHRLAGDVAHAIRIEHIAVAAIERSVPFHRGAMTADRFVYAQSRRSACEIADGCLESLDELASNVLFAPLIECIT